MTTRRQFLEVTAGTTMAVGLGTQGATRAAQGVRDEAPDVEVRNRRETMAYRRLGRTGYLVSEIVMGGNEIRPDNYEHILLALDMGLNYLDTAPAYGRGASERGYAEVIKRRPRDQFFLTSKISPWDINRNDTYRKIFNDLDEATQETIRRQVDEDLARRRADDPDHFVSYFRSQRRELEGATLANVMEPDYGHLVDRAANYKQIILDSVDESLGRLGTDHLDLMLCPHGASSGYELRRYPEIFEAFEILRDAGKVRNLGVSSHSDPAGVLEAALDTAPYAMAMVAYNIVNHKYLDALIDRAAAEDFGVIGMKVARPVYPGGNRPPIRPDKADELDRTIPGDLTIPQKAFAWALSNPNLSAAVANMVNEEQVRENLILPGQLKA